MNRLLAIFLGLMLVLGFGTNVRADDEEIALDKIPAKVKAAALKAVKGLVITEAEVEKKKGVLVYEIEGTANGKSYEIKIKADGTVIEVEEEEEEEEEEEDEDDDDDDR